MTKRFTITLLFIIILAVLLVSTPALAQNIGFEGPEGKSTLDIIAGKAFYQTNVKDETFIDTVIGQLIAIFLGFLGILFLTFIIYSGFQWMTAGGNEDKVTQSKTRIKNSVIGLALIFFSFIISNFVFTFFYKESGRQISPSQECRVDDNCPHGLVCINNICQPPPEQAGHRCESNADCPASEPVCKQFLLWKYCVECDLDADCIRKYPNQSDKAHCYHSLDTNFCSECTNDGQCPENLPKCEGGQCRERIGGGF